MCTQVVENAKQHLTKGDTHIKKLEEISRVAQVKGRGVHSKQELEYAVTRCEEVFKADLDTDAAVRALTPLMKLHTAPP